MVFVIAPVMGAVFASGTLFIDGVSPFYHGLRFFHMQRSVSPFITFYLQQVNELHIYDFCNLKVVPVSFLPFVLTSPGTLLQRILH